MSGTYQGIPAVPVGTPQQMSNLLQALSANVLQLQAQLATLLPTATTVNQMSTAANQATTAAASAQTSLADAEAQVALAQSWANQAYANDNAAQAAASTASTAATTAATAATNAATSATGAGNSATAAAGSATSASSSASAASGSAAAASASATAAATSQSNAASSAASAATSATNAAGSASSATTQASNAANSASAAGASASAASTSASSASTDANSANSSAISASNSANTATTQAGNASNSASAASTSSAAASSSAAAAQTSATLSASVGTAALNLNPIFAIWPTTTFPTNWQDWTNGVANTSKVTGPISPYAVQINGVAGSDTGIGSSTSFSLTPNGWYVIEADIELVSGALTAAGVWVSLSDSSGAYIGDVAINFATDPDIAGATNGAGVAGTSYKYRKLVQVTPSTTSSGNIYAMAHSSALGSTTAANSIQFQRVDIRPASSAEILANTVNVNVNALSATVTTQAGAIATLDGRTAAYLEFSASTSGGTALFILDSTSYGTSVALSGDHIYLGDGITVTPSATDPTIQYVGTSYQLVTGLNFGASSNLLEWYGPVGIAISAMTTANALQYIDNGGNTTGGTKTFVQSTDPAGSNTVANGSFWYDDASGVFYLRAGGAWQAVGGQIADGAVVFTGGSGSGTYTVPLNAPGYVTVTITGGHGGAGEVQTSGPWLGGGGGTATYHFAVTPGSTTISYSLGNNGANSNTGNGAGGGGSTCTSSAFSGTMIANGGAGGTPANTSAGGTASGPSGGTYTTGGTSAGIPGPSITITAHTT